MRSNPASPPRIEGLRMQTVYYSLMKKLLAVVGVVVWGILLAGVSTGQEARPLRTSILDSHEGGTIGVEPWAQASRYKAKFPKKSPYAAGSLGLRLRIRRHDNEAR